MRQRAAGLFLACVLLTTVFIVLLPGRRRNSLNAIVKETQEKISVLGGRLIPQQDEEASDQELAPDPSYLTVLGLSGPGWPLLHPHGSWLVAGRASQPCLVTAVEPGQAELGLGFVRSARHFLPDTTVLMYDLGLSKYEKELLVKSCNSTTCTLLNFEFSVWPPHVRELRLHAYRPIIIQLTLRDVGSVVWLDVDLRLTDHDLSPWLEQARGAGLVVWQHEEGQTGGGAGLIIEGPTRVATATTSLTHHRMFDFFPGTNYEDYAFQHMASCSSMVLLYTARVHSELMLPWLKCVLTEVCINPIGAQDTGCRFDKKPQYRYSGCHRYDMSALNIVLGNMFSFQESSYMRTQGPWDKTFFRRVDQDPSIESVSSDMSANLSFAPVEGYRPDI